MIHTTFIVQGSDETKKDDKDDAFDLTVTGPWIGRWEISNENQHTEAFKHVTGSTRVDNGSQADPK